MPFAPRKFITEYLIPNGVDFFLEQLSKLEAPRELDVLFTFLLQGAKMAGKNTHITDEAALPWLIEA